jgi:hypothetical protein
MSIYLNNNIINVTQDEKYYFYFVFIMRVPFFLQQ